MATIKQLKYIAIGLVVIALLAFSGRYGYKYLKEQENTFKSQINALEYDIILLNDSLDYYSNRLIELDAKEKDYYYDYVKEYNRRIKAEKALRNIRDLTFNKPYLDSLAGNIRYD